MGAITNNCHPSKRSRSWSVLSGPSFVYMHIASASTPMQTPIGNPLPSKNYSGEHHTHVSHSIPHHPFKYSWGPIFFFCREKEYSVSHKLNMHEFIRCLLSIFHPKHSLLPRSFPKINKRKLTPALCNTQTLNFQLILTGHNGFLWPVKPCLLIWWVYRIIWLDSLRARSFWVLHNAGVKPLIGKVQKANGRSDKKQTFIRVRRRGNFPASWYDGLRLMQVICFSCSFLRVSSLTVIFTPLLVFETSQLSYLDKIILKERSDGVKRIRREGKKEKEWSVISKWAK